MRLQVRILGRELLAVEHDHQPAPSPPAEPQAQPEPEIPAGFGFHGGAGGSQQAAWQPAADGVTPEHCYRAEVWHEPRGGSVLRAFSFALDDQGRHYLGEDGEIAKQQTADIPITRPAPRYS